MDLILVAILPGLTGYLEGLQLQRRLMSLRQQEKIRDILPIGTSCGAHLGENAAKLVLFPDLADQRIKVSDGARRR